MRFLSIYFAKFFANFFDKNFKSFNKLNNKREVIAWSFYDFANQPFTTIIITFLYAPYFSLVICNSETQGDSLWALGIAITAIFVSILSPILGAISDSGGFRKFFFVLSTWICIICTACLFFFKEGDVYSALIYVIIANIRLAMNCLIEVNSKYNHTNSSPFTLHPKSKTMNEENWVDDEINMLIGYLLDNAKN